MLADDTNLFFSNCNTPVLFATVNSELSKMSQWFLTNKLPLNVTKTKYITSKTRRHTTKITKALNKQLQYRKNSVN